MTVPGRRRANRRFRTDEGGQLLLLAGIILVLSFVSMAFTLAQLADVDKRAASEQEADFVGEYRFMREKLGSVLRDSTGTSTDEVSFRLTFDTTAESHRMALLSKGFDARLVLASTDTGLELPECEWLAARCTDLDPATADYAIAEPVNGDIGLTHDFDGASDGIIWTCPGTANEFISGVVVYLSMADGTTSIEETLVYAVNHDAYKVHMAAPAC